MYGIKVGEEGKSEEDWWVMSTGAVFWTEHIRVAIAQAESVEQVWNKYTTPPITARVYPLPEHA